MPCRSLVEKVTVIQLLKRCPINAVFWNVFFYGLINSYQDFGRTWHLHLYYHHPLKYSELPMILWHVINQQITLCNCTTLKTSKPLASSEKHLYQHHTLSQGTIYNAIFYNYPSQGMPTCQLKSTSPCPFIHSSTHNVLLGYGTYTL